MVDIPKMGYGCPSGELETRTIGGAIECVDNANYVFPPIDILLIDPLGVFYGTTTVAPDGSFSFAEVPAFQGYSVTYNPNDLPGKESLIFPRWVVNTTGDQPNILFTVQQIADLGLVGDACLTVKCESGELLSGVDVNLMLNGNVVQFGTTDANGYVEFLQVTSGAGYTMQIVTPSELYIQPATGWNNLTNESDPFVIAQSPKAELEAEYKETMNRALSRVVVKSASTDNQVFKIRNVDGQIIGGVAVAGDLPEGDFGHVPALSGLTIEGPGLPVTPLNNQAYATTEVTV